MNGSKHFGRTSARGFTLIELLAVMGIIIILIGLVMELAGVASSKAAESKARADIQKLAQEADEIILAGGTPAAPTLKDPWDKAYQRKGSGKSWTFFSCGQDGISGNSDDIY